MGLSSLWRRLWRQPTEQSVVLAPVSQPSPVVSSPRHAVVEADVPVPTPPVQPAIMAGAADAAILEVASDAGTPPSDGVPLASPASRADVDTLPIVESTLPDGRPYKLDIPVSGHIDDSYLDAVRNGHYKDGTWNFFVSWLRPGDVFLDLGASLGVYTIPAAVLGAQVHAFELIEANARRVASSAVLNGLGSVRLNLGAVSDTHGTVGFMEGHSAWSMVTDDHFFSVAAIVVDNYVRQRNLARVDVMKIDVEGSERAALQGARDMLRRDHPDIIIESNVFTCGMSGYSYREPLALLAEEGYRLYRFFGDRLVPWQVSDAQEVICTDYFASTKTPEQIEARSGWRVVQFTAQEQIASVLEQGHYTSRHTTHVLAVAEGLPDAVQGDPAVAEALTQWRAQAEPELLALLRTGAR